MTGEETDLWLHTMLISAFSLKMTVNCKIKRTGNSLAVQWLGLRAFTAVAWVQSLVRELRSHKPGSTAKKKKKRMDERGINRKNDRFLEDGKHMRTSLVAQWLRIRLPMQGTRVRGLVWEDPTCRKATKPVRHNYWACALEPVSHNYWPCVLQLLKPACLEPVLHNKRSHCSEKPAHCNRVLPLAATRESPHAEMKTQCSQK